eukprot:1343573-Alexandrium_andersonii.AAC.1
MRLFAPQSSRCACSATFTRQLWTDASGIWCTRSTAPTAGLEEHVLTRASMLQSGGGPLGGPSAAPRRTLAEPSA